MEALLFAGLEQMRKRLSWRKWYRTTGLAYVQPLTSELERKWIESNKFNEILALPASQRILIKPVIEVLYFQQLMRERLNPDLIRGLLLQHYEDYAKTPTEYKFLLWYLESLYRLVNGEEEEPTNDIRVEFRRQYQNLYFRQTFLIDYTTKTIDDATIWYYLQCIYGKNSRLSIRTDLQEGQILYEYNDVKMLFDSDSTVRVSDGNIFLNGEIPRSFLDVTKLPIDGGPKTETKIQLKNDQKINLYYLRFGTLFNTFDNCSNCADKGIVDTARTAFEVLLKRPTEILDHLLRTNATLNFDGSSCDNFSEINELGMSMIDIIDEIEWGINLIPQKEYNPHTRFTATANIAQLLAKKLMATKTATLSGLNVDPTDAAFQSVANNTQIKAKIYVTNVMINSTDHEAQLNSFFVQHEKQASTISAFIRPDQDPAAVRVLDLFNDSDDTQSAGPQAKFLRWIVVRASKNKTDDEPLDRMKLLFLLRDLDKTFENIQFRVDSFMSRTPPQSWPSAKSGDLLGKNYTSSTRLPLGTNIPSITASLKNGGILMVATVQANHYAPTDTNLLWQSRPGFVPWELDCPQIFNWKCYTTRPTENIDEVTSKDVNLLIQRESKSFYALTDRSEIEQFLRNVGSHGGINAPITRVISSATPLPFTIYKIVSKRIFALSDGTVFITTLPIKFSPKLDKINPRSLKYLDKRTACPFQLTSIDCGFKSGSLYGSKVWFPIRLDLSEVSRCYKNVPKGIAPLVDWLDSLLAG